MLERMARTNVLDSPVLLVVVLLVGIVYLLGFIFRWKWIFNEKRYWLATKKTARVIGIVFSSLIVWSALSLLITEHVLRLFRK